MIQKTKICQSLEWSLMQYELAKVQTKNAEDNFIKTKLMLIESQAKMLIPTNKYTNHRSLPKIIEVDI